MNNDLFGCLLIYMAGLIDDTYMLFEQAYDFFNQKLFDASLPQCLITFQRQNRLMGYASFKRWKNNQNEYIHELAINPEYFANFPLVEIFQTLCHEMVHIWQEHNGTPSRRGYHNTEWAKKMISIGLMPSTTGRPGGDIVGEKLLDYALEDGQFLSGCKELIESGFSIKWFDTFAVPNHRPQNIKKHLGNNAAALATSIATPATSVQLLEDPSLPFSTEQLDNALRESMGQLETISTPSLATEAPSQLMTTRPKKSSDRNKYYCAHCFAQVWGKPGLNVACGDCNQTLIEVN